MPVPPRHAAIRRAAVVDASREQPRAAGRMTSEAGCRPVPARHKCDFGGVVPAMTPSASEDPSSESATQQHSRSRIRKGRRESPGLAGQRSRAWPASARADCRWGKDGHEAAGGDTWIERLRW